MGALKWRGLFGILASLGLLTSCGGSAPTVMGQQTIDLANSVVIPRSADIFDPYILTTQPHATVTWHNADTVAHTIVTVPQHSTYLNPTPFALRVGAGQSVTLTPTQPGIYYYYDTSAGDWSATYGRVVAHKGLPKYPMSMEGILWVQGPIAGLPSIAHNSVLHLRDEIATFITAVRTGGTVSWQNHDTDAHYFQTVLGWDPPINPVEVGIDNILGTNDMPPDGQVRAITFTTPGLYYYLCFTHATIDPLLLRVYARPMASELPVAMEGFVLVTNG